MPADRPDRYGRLEPAGDGWRLRFTRQLPSPPEAVWRALTEPEHLRAWFPQQVVGEWAVGARLRFVSPGGEFEGEVLACQRPHLLEFRWGTDTIRLEVAPAGPNGSVLTLLDTFDEVGKAARDAAGWHVCLDSLEREPAGGPGGVTLTQNWRAVHTDYLERLGPEAATIGPPEVPVSRPGYVSRITRGT